MLFERLEADLSAAPALVAGPPPRRELEAIENYAGFPLPPSYREFVERFGAAIVGSHPVYGRGAAEAMGSAEASVVDVTERFRSDHWPSCGDALVVSMDHGGNPFTLTADGQVRRYDHDSGEIETVAQDFERFIAWCLSHRRP